MQPAFTQPAVFAPTPLLQLLAAAFTHAEIPRAGQRLAVDHPLVSAATRWLLSEPALAPLLPQPAQAIQALLFSKSAESGRNWSVPWHQDRWFPLPSDFDSSAGDHGWTLPVMQRARASLPTREAVGQPPLALHRQLRAVRIHLDAAGSANGGLSFLNNAAEPGSAAQRVLNDSAIALQVSPQLAQPQQSTTPELAAGEVLIFSPLALHRSASALPGAAPRRLLHLVIAPDTRH